LKKRTKKLNAAGIELEKQKKERKELEKDNKKLSGAIARQDEMMEETMKKVREFEAVNVFSPLNLVSVQKLDGESVDTFSYSVCSPKSEELNVVFELTDLMKDGMVRFNPVGGTMDTKDAPDFMQNTVFIEKGHLPLLLSYVVIELAKYSDRLEEKQ